MKILHVITSLRMGGAEKLVSEIVPLFRDKGHEVDVLAFDGVDTPFKQSLLNKGIKVYSFGENCFVYNPLFIFKLMRMMKQYDVVHAHNTAPQLFAAIGSCFNSVKMITTEHSTSNHRRDSGIFKHIDRWMYNRYDSIICISNMTYTNLINYLGSSRARIITIENGIDVKKYIVSQPLSQVLKNSNRFIITMVAGFRYQKDYETAIRAMALLDKTKYEMWFVGDGERRPEIEKYICKYGVSDNIRLWGFRSDVNSILKSSDVVLQSSHIEGFGLAAVEGMAVGKPVIATNIPGLGQVVDGAGILFQHENEHELATAITLLYSDLDFYSLIASKCTKRALDYDISKMVQKYDHLYREVNRNTL